VGSLGDELAQRNCPPDDLFYRVVWSAFDHGSQQIWFRAAEAYIHAPLIVEARQRFLLQIAQALDLIQIGALQKVRRGDHLGVTLDT